MFIIILSILTFIFAILSFIVAVRITKLNIINNLLESRNNELTFNIKNLAQEKIENLRQIEHLNSKTEYLEKEIKIKEESSSNVVASAKAALFELGKELSTQLIEAHKQENQESKNIAKENIESITKSFQTELEQLVSKINVVGHYMQESNSTFDAIKNSLLSSVHAGNFAELTLENILISSGLVQNKDFILQDTISNDTNNKLRPDAIIFLPNDTCIIIDAKCSKFLFQEESETQLTKSISQHLKNLSSKEYAKYVQENYKLRHAITLMFLPSESSIDKISALDKNFLKKSWEQNIFPVGPSSLMNMLSLARLQVNQQMRTENYKEIFEEISRLISSISALIQNCHKVGANIQTLVNNYDKFVSCFNSGVLARTKNIIKLGINTSSSSISALDRYQLISSKNELIE